MTTDVRIDGTTLPLTITTLPPPSETATAGETVGPMDPAAAKRYKSPRPLWHGADRLPPRQ